MTKQVTTPKEISIDDLRGELKDSAKNKRILGSLFLLALLTFILLIYFSPKFTEEEKKKIYKFPKKGSDLVDINDVISRYTKDHYFYVVIAFCYLYIFLQSFAIPGPIFLSILSGSLFGGIRGFLLVCMCATFGASACYGLSYTFGRQIVINRFPNQLIKFKKKVVENKNNLFWYTLFLRITPLFPNWSVNIFSPIVGLYFKHFFFGTLFGLMPANIIHVRTGLVLHDIEQVGMSLSTILGLVALSFLALIPTLFKKKLEHEGKLD